MDLSPLRLLASEIENFCCVCYVAVGVLFRTVNDWLVGHCARSFQCAGRHVFVAPPV